MYRSLNQLTNSNQQSGFTLVEVVVVIAVVALLSAIIVPVVAKQIDDAKISRAQNECVVIAAAIQQFYKDVGTYPSHNGTNPNTIRGLVSGTAVDPDVAGTAIEYGFTADGNDDWYDAAGAAAQMDIFDNHLNVNSPQGNADAYATTGEFRWKGPYLAPIGMDPWNHPYMCNIYAAFHGSGTMCVVMSAGPNGVIDTTYTGGVHGVASTTTGPSEDDIWTVVTTRP